MATSEDGSGIRFSKESALSAGSSRPTPASPEALVSGVSASAEVGAEPAPEGPSSVGAGESGGVLDSMITTPINSANKEPIPLRVELSTAADVSIAHRHMRRNREK